MEIWWDRSIKISQKMEHNHPDIAVVGRAAQKWMFVNFLVPWERNKDENTVTPTTLLWQKKIRKLCYSVGVFKDC